MDEFKTEIIAVLIGVAIGAAKTILDMIAKRVKEHYGIDQIVDREVDRIKNDNGSDGIYVSKDDKGYVKDVVQSAVGDELKNRGIGAIKSMVIQILGSVGSSAIKAAKRRL